MARGINILAGSLEKRMELRGCFLVGNVGMPPAA